MNPLLPSCTTALRLGGSAGLCTTEGERMGTVVPCTTALRPCGGAARTTRKTKTVTTAKTAD